MRAQMHEQYEFPARLDCRYLAVVPEALTDRSLLVLAMHGYGQDPEVMLRLTRGMLGSRHVIASIQAPNQQYLSPNSPSPEMGYNWGTSRHGDSNIRLHHDMVLHVAAELRSRFTIPARKTLLLGFSQPVGFNYRFAGTHPDQIGGVIGLCGGVPKNWEQGDYKPVTAALLHIAREEDEFYPPAVTAKYAERLRSRAQDVEFHLLPGGHRFPSKAGPLVESWINRVVGQVSDLPDSPRGNA